MKTRWFSLTFYIQAALVTVLAVVGGFTAAAQDMEVQTQAGATPWTHLEYVNDPDNFQFAVVTDRTGGARPGVYPAVLERVNEKGPPPSLPGTELCAGTTDIECVYREAAPEARVDDE